MYQTEQHVMVLEKVHPSGVEEWHCPICSRRFLVQWPPEYKKIILEPGDEHASHSGAKGEPLTDAPGLNRPKQLVLSDVWRAAIESLDFSSWPD